MRVCKHDCDVKIFCFSALITQARIWKRFWVEKIDKITLFTHFLVGWNLKNLWKHAVSICFAWADILSEKNPYFGEHLFYKTKTDYAYKLRVQDVATLKNFSFNQCSKQETSVCFFFFFSRESYFIKAIVGFHMTSLKFKLKNYRFYRDCTFTMH